MEEQDAPLSPAESESTIATENLPDTADWIALRKRHSSQHQSLPLTSASFDSQETILTEDLPSTSDWLRLRGSHLNRQSNKKSPTATRTESQADKVSSPPEATTNALKLAPVKVTPASHNTSDQHITGIGTSTIKPRPPDRSADACDDHLDQKQNANPDPAAHHSSNNDSEETTWSVDANQGHQEQNQNGNPAVNDSEETTWSVHENQDHGDKIHIGNPIVNDSEETRWSVDASQGHREQIQNTNPSTADNHSSNNNILNDKHHPSPASQQCKSDPVSPLTEDQYTQRRRRSQSINWKHQSQNTPVHRLPANNDAEHIPNSPLVVTRRRPSLLPESSSPSNQSVASDPLVLLAPPTTRTTTTAKKPPSILVSTNKKKPTQHDDYYNDSSDATPSPPLKQQPWFQKKTKKRKLKQMRLNFG